MRPTDGAQYTISGASTQGSRRVLKVSIDRFDASSSSSSHHGAARGIREIAAIAPLQRAFAARTTNAIERSANEIDAIRSRSCGKREETHLHYLQSF